MDWLAERNNKATPPRTRLNVELMEGRIVPTATVTIGTPTPVAEGGDLVFPVYRTDTTGSLTVELGITGTATADTDYTTPDSFVSFANGKSTAYLTVETLDDGDEMNPGTPEPTETVVVTIEESGENEYDVGDPASATGEILDNDADVVSVTALYQAREDGAQGQFLFTRIGDLSGSLAVDYSVGGTATPSTDYTALSGTVMFAAGSATAGVAVVASHDDEYDPGETVTVTIDSGTGYDIGAEDEAEVTIADDASYTFTLDSTEGEIWFDVDWDGVDPDEATDTADLTDVAVMFDGDLFTDSNATFTTSPVAHFEYGDLVSIEFTIAFSSAVTGSESLVVANGQVRGVDATTHQAGDPAEMQNTSPAQIIFDFSPMDFPDVGDVAWTITATTEAGGNPTETAPTQIEIPANGTPGAVRDAMETTLKGFGLVVKPSGDTRLIVSGPEGRNLRDIKILVHDPVLPSGPSAVKAKNGAPSAPTFTYNIAP